MTDSSKSPGANFDQLIKRVQWGANNGGGIGAMMGFMGLPYQQKRGGQWMTINPATRSVYQTGTTNPVQRPQQPQEPPTGGDDPGTTGNPEDDALIKAGMTPWYVDWLNKNGKYGYWKQPYDIPGLLG